MDCKLLPLRIAALQAAASVRSPHSVWQLNSAGLRSSSRPIISRWPTCTSFPGSTASCRPSTKPASWGIAPRAALWRWKQLQYPIEFCAIRSPMSPALRSMLLLPPLCRRRRRCSATITLLCQMLAPIAQPCMIAPCSQLHVCNYDWCPQPTVRPASRHGLPLVRASGVSTTAARHTQRDWQTPFTRSPPVARRVQACCLQPQGRITVFLARTHMHAVSCPTHAAAWWHNIPHHEGG